MESTSPQAAIFGGMLNMSENKTPVIYRNLTYLADVSGTGFWRRVAPITTLNCVSQELKMLNTYTMEPVT